MLCNALSMFQDTAPGLKRKPADIFACFQERNNFTSVSIRFRPERDYSQRHRARLLLATDRHGACGNAHTSCRVGHKCRAVQINSAIAPRRAKTSAVHWPCLYAFSLPPLEPLGEGSPCIRQRPACTTEVIAPTPSVTIICGRYCANSPPACVLNAPVIATYSPGAVASIQGQENIQ